MTRMSRLMLAALVLLLVCSLAGAAGNRIQSSAQRATKTDTGIQPIPASQAPVVRSTPKAWMTLHTQDFETAMEPWTHTNGLAFPSGWDRQSYENSGHATWACPSSGSWSMWIDSDADGGLVTDDAWSPAIATSGYDTIKAVFANSFNYFAAGDNYQVMHRTFSTGTWSAWTVDRNYTADVLPSWDSISVIGPVDSFQLGFYYTADYGWYVAVDNITITGFQSMLAQDVKPVSIDTPATVVVPPSVAFHGFWTIKNVGTGPASDFTTHYNIYDSTGALLYGPSGSITTPDTLFPDSTRQFSGVADFTPDSLMRYQVEVITDLAGDLRPENDTMRFSFRTYDRNVGATAILAPGALLAPNATIAPSATYHNFATEAATFNAYFRVDFGGVPVYTENTTITDLAPGADTTITFPDWAAPHDAGAHQLYAYTYQDLDVNPANDTVQQSIMVAFMGWTALTPTAAVPAQWPGSCTDGEKLYIVGGLYPSSTASNYVQVYDTTTGWSQLTTLPTAVVAPSCAVIAGKLYVVGGVDAAFAAQSYTQIYDIAGNSWSAGTAPVSARGGSSGGVVDGKMYIVGGMTSGSFPTDCPTYEYDPAADTASGTPWTAKTDCPRGATGMTLGAMFNGAPGLNVVYAGGDYRGTTSSLNVFYSYDPALDSWTTIAAPPADVGGKMPGLAWTNDHAYLFGGCPAGAWVAPWSAKTYIYDPLADSWTDAAISMNSAYEGMGFGIINQKLFSFGGTIGSGPIDPPNFEWTYTSEYTGVAGQPATVTVPGTLKLYGCAPNPSKNGTTLSFQLPRDTRVNLAVYSITGQLVKTLLSENRPAGHQSVKWNGRDNNGRSVSSGIYFYRLNADGNSATGKMVVIR
jgi:hypothetical protein